jgi:hypothetical protein
MTKKVNEISTGDYYSKAHKAKIKAAAGMMFADPAKPETQKAMRDFKNRDAGMKRVSARNQKAQAAAGEKARQDALAADRENLPGLMAQYQKLRKEFDPNFEYSDDHSFWSKQKGIQQQLGALQKRINDAGGKMSEDAAIKAFLDKGGVIQKLPYKKPRKADKTDYGSKHIGTLGGKGTKGQVTGRGANTRTGNKPVVSVEGFNPEYDDEAGMAHNSLQTIHRATVGLSKVIGEGDNLPEWCQEKLSIAEDYLVTVWDYIQSEQNMSEDNVQEWKKDRKAPIKPRNFVAKNATTGGAGAHKDKKKDAKQGKVKHKKKPELAETATYDRRLNVLLEAKMLTDQIKQYRKK